MGREERVKDPAEVVRALFDAGNQARRGDRDATQRWYELLDPGISWEIDPITSGLVGDFAPLYRGRQGVSAFFAQWLEQWEDYESILQELEVIEGRVLARATIRGRGQASGAIVEWTHFEIWDVVDGRATALRTFRDRDAALAEISGGE